MGAETKKGLVIKSTGCRYRVSDEGGQLIDCVIKGKFRVKGIRTTNPVAVGDYVYYETGGEKGSGVITAIEERKNYIIRKASRLSKESQIIAANIDQLMLLATIREPETHPEFIDRVLVTAEAYRIPVKIVFNKTDIYSEKDLAKRDHLVSVYRGIGYDTSCVSLFNNEDIEMLAGILKDRISLLAGNSGVGKSSLINKLESGLNIKVEEISEYHRMGKHTTTFAEMYTLSNGGYIIDTPGIKGFGLIDMDKEEIYHFFPEIFRASDKCRFYNCLHVNEPGCEVLRQLEEGIIEESRYRSYLKIFNDNDSRYR
ncbi:MAG TPA: ribosome small subunit-dependent GTPase A [Desulfobacteraceae bacterium]|mgnify:CR=1 FL=1|nr:ribosome small subunit-dependent GTPase A [Desulfobacteraceae bacterium]